MIYCVDCCYSFVFFPENRVKYRADITGRSLEKSLQDKNTIEVPAAVTSAKYHKYDEVLE